MSRRSRAGSRSRERALLRAIRPTETEGIGREDGPLLVHRVRTGGDLLALDHVALAVADPDAMTAFLCEHLGLRVLHRTPGVVVVSADERAARLLIAAADGPRDPGALGRLVLRVADVARAVAALPAEAAVEGDQIERARFEGPEGLALGFTLVAGGGIDYDLDHVVLRVRDPETTRVALAGAGFTPRGPSLHVADKRITLTDGEAGGERPLLDHIAVRVDSVDAVASQARERGLEIEARSDDAFVLVLPGPEQIRLRFIEQPRRDAP